ncbi:GTP cyclohydrolase II RibA [Nonomuraea sp. NPDC049141]|uniref:GTP cyclohydrolase II RibA n=1 Tax=Nonomuraea sp. NPDC049141 TaxID=3155500 RepID=UPI003411B802
MSPPGTRQAGQDGASVQEPSPWRSRRFVLFATGNTVNNVGEGVYTAALPLLAFDLTGSVVLMSLLAALVPIGLLLGPLFGVVVDRWGPRVLVVPGLVVQIMAASALNVFALADGAPIVLLFVLGGIIQLAGAAYRAGWMAGVPTMFPECPVRSRGTLKSLFLATLVIGPLLVGLLLPVVGYLGLLWFNVVTCVVPILVWAMRIKPPRLVRLAPAGVRALGADLVDGWRIFRADRAVMIATVIKFPLVFIGSSGTMTLALFILQDRWKIPADKVGLIMTGCAVGGLAGSLALSQRREFRLYPSLIAGAAGLTVALFAMAVPVLAALIAAMVLLTAVNGMLAASLEMMIVKHVPQAGIGRVSGILRLLGGIPAFVAPLLVPVGVAAIGAQPTFALLGAVGLAAAVWLHRTRLMWRETAPDAGERVAVRSSVLVPLAATEAAALDTTMVTFSGLVDGLEHLAVLFGDPAAQDSPLVRLHSECLTGDVFGSARCDCGPQLRHSIDLMRSAGGVILYLRQEGRGIGLYNKIDAYRLQELGYDTFEANRKLGFPADLRNFSVAAQMLTAIGVSEIRLLSNSPDKAAQLAANGITVRNVTPTTAFVTEANREYLRTKIRYAGHLIDLDENLRRNA